MVQQTWLDAAVGVEAKEERVTEFVHFYHLATIDTCNNNVVG